MTVDRSEGYEHFADYFMAARSDVGGTLVAAWAREMLAAGASIVDLGCGSGVPITRALVEQGFKVSGIDASPTMIAAFREHFPEAESACQAAQDTDFFGRRFDAVVSVGMLFLLSEADQRLVIGRCAQALVPGGRFLFTAPSEVLEWGDVITQRRSRSLGAAAYEAVLASSGLRLVGCRRDAGDNHYYDAILPLTQP